LPSLVSHTGREAVDRVLANGIDILILDLRLPLLNGLEAGGAAGGDRKVDGKTG
jgi:DNA-binding response OmpR family regulator